MTGTGSWRGKMAAAADARAAQRERDSAAVAARYMQARAVPVQRVPLTASQHILHLLLTVFTAGLWLPVWIVRAAQGNRVARG